MNEKHALRCPRILVQFLVCVAVLFSGLSRPVFAQAPAATVPEVLRALSRSDTASALNQCDRLLRVHPRDARLQALRGAVLERAGRASDALAAYRKALAIDPRCLPALEGAAQLEYKAQSAQAEPLLGRILTLQPANSVAHAMLGMIEYRARNCTAAVTDFSSAGSTLNAQPDALMAYAICLVRLDRLSDAVPRFQQLVAIRPESEPARYDLALVQWRSSGAEEALGAIESLIERHAASARTLRLAADIHESRNETPAAVELLRAAILADPHDAANYIDFATLAFMHGSFDVGIDMINRGLTQLPRSPDLYLARGVLYGQNSQFEKAIADFEQAHALDPSFSLTASAEGIAYSQRHDHAAALMNFRRQVAEHPQDALGHYLLAEALSWAPPDSGGAASADSVTGAIAEAKEAIALDPRLVEAHDLLATLYLQDGQIDEAIKVSRAALVLEPRDQQALYSLILALRKSGEKDDLKGLVQRLMELRKSESTDNSRKMRYGRLAEVQEE